MSESLPAYGRSIDNDLLVQRIGPDAAGRVNAIANHPDVLRWVADDTSTPLDLEPALRDPGVVALLGAHGAMLFSWKQAGVYECHTMVLPEGRGAWTLSFVHACLRWMFGQTDAIEILTRVPVDNPRALHLVRLIHGTLLFRNEQGWKRDGEFIPADIYSLTIQEWMRTAPGLEERGRWFHARLEAEFARVGYAEPNHPEDAMHDRYVGAAVEMVLGNNGWKGCIFYNRWAAMAGYAAVSMVSLDPLTIDIQSAVLVIRDGGFYVAVHRRDAVH